MGNEVGRWDPFLPCSSFCGKLCCCMDSCCCEEKAAAAAAAAGEGVEVRTLLYSIKARLCLELAFCQEKRTAF
jgi:hypothetical protein